MSALNEGPEIRPNGRDAATPGSPRMNSASAMVNNVAFDDFIAPKSIQELANMFDVPRLIEPVISATTFDDVKSRFNLPEVYTDPASVSHHSPLYAVNPFTALQESQLQQPRFPDVENYNQRSLGQMLRNALDMEPPSSPPQDSFKQTSQYSQVPSSPNLSSNIERFPSCPPPIEPDTDLFTVVNGSNAAAGCSQTGCNYASLALNAWQQTSLDQAISDALSGTVAGYLEGSSVTEIPTSDASLDRDFYAGFVTYNGGSSDIPLAPDLYDSLGRSLTGHEGLSFSSAYGVYRGHSESGSDQAALEEAAHGLTERPQEWQAASSPRGPRTKTVRRRVSKTPRKPRFSSGRSVRLPNPEYTKKSKHGGDALFMLFRVGSSSKGQTSDA